MAASGRPQDAADLAARSGVEAVEDDHALWAIWLLHDAVRLGTPDPVLAPLEAAVELTRGAALQEIMPRHAHALVDRDAPGLLGVAASFASHGAHLLAAEAAAQASALCADAGDEVAAARAATRSRRWERATVDAATPALATQAAGPSTREMDVTLEALAGHTSQEIAGHLYISRRTVDNHLRSVYRKLDISGRDELADIL